MGTLRTVGFKQKKEKIWKLILVKLHSFSDQRKSALLKHP